MELDRPPSDVADRPSSVLVLAEGLSGAGDRLCGDLLTVDDPDATGLLLVTLVDSPARRLGVWDRAATGRPARVIAVATTDAVGGATAEDGCDVRTISNPSNLTRLGVTITEALADLDGTRPAVCFHSLSVLLQYASADQVFQFLSVLTARLDAAEATAHFHLDPTTQDERTVATLRQLFDAVVDAESA